MGSLACYVSARPLWSCKAQRCFLKLMKHQHTSYTSATGSLCTANVKAAKSTSEKSIGNVANTLKFPCKGLFSHVSRADLQSQMSPEPNWTILTELRVSGDKYTLSWECYQFHIISKERISRCITPLQDIHVASVRDTGTRPPLSPFVCILKQETALMLQINLSCL